MASSKEQKKKAHIGKNPLDWIKSTKEEIKIVDAVVPEVKKQEVKAETKADLTERAGREVEGAAKVQLKTAVQNKPVELKLKTGPQPVIDSKASLYYLIPVSAKSEEILIQRIKDLIDWISDEGFAQSIGNIAFTLGAGRSHFAVRAALIVSSVENMVQSLKAVYVSGNTEDFFSSQHEGKVQRLEQGLKEFAEKTAVEIGKGYEEGCGENKEKLSVLAGLYVKGYDINWDTLYRKGLFRKVSMPTYPFLRDRYWVETEEKGYGGKKVIKALHPLIDNNSSTLYEESFVKAFDESEFFLKDHVIGKDMILPGVAYLEMVRAAAGFADIDNKVAGFKDVVWVNPIKLDSEGNVKEVNVGLYPENGLVEYEVTSELESGARILHGRGKIIFENSENVKPLSEVMDIDEIKQRCTKSMEGKLCYDSFNSRGLMLGRSFRSIVELYSNEREVLAELELPSHLKGDFNEFELHPTLMDGALEAVIGLVGNTSEQSGALSLPFAINNVEIYDRLTTKCYSYASESNVNVEEGVRKFDVSILDRQGKVLVKMKGFSLKALDQGLPGQQTEMLYYNSVWEESPLSGNKPIESDGGHIVYLGEEGELYNALKDAASCGTTLVKQGKYYEKIKKGVYQVCPGSREDFEKLIVELKNEGIQPDKFINAWWKDSRFNGIDTGDGAFYSLLALTQATALKMPDSRVRCVYTYNCDAGSLNPFNDAVSGFAKSVNVENTKFTYKTVGIERSLSTLSAAVILINEIGPGDRHEVDIKYEKGKRLVKVLKELSLEGSAKKLSLKDNGVYLITGGAGGLGLILAGCFTGKARAKLVLVGRSELSDRKNAKIDELKASGCEIVYIKTDICDKKQVNELVKKVKSLFGQINGVIHSAGVMSDASVQNKTAALAGEVIAPKVYGTMYIDEALKDENLDFFAMFSSIAAVTGNAGQCDYSYANCFMDSFALYRQALVGEGKRKGHTISFNWPLWKDGGMRVDRNTETMFANTMGIVPLETVKGLDAFFSGISHGMTSFLVVDGVRKKAEKALGITKHKVEASQAIQVDEKVVGAKIQEALIGIVSKLLKVKEKDISLSKDISEYGFNSLTLTDLSNSINEKFEIDITPAVFFEHSTLGSLNTYLFTEYRNEMVKLFGQEQGVEERDAETQNEKNLKDVNEVLSEYKPRSRYGTAYGPGSKKPAGTKYSAEPIAIIGMSGVMPQSEDLDEFWKNLESQKDLISEIPADRWDWRKLTGVSAKGSDKPVSKWGGFMKEVDKFDAMFFGISPREAQLMDPQQRLFLQIVWKTVEDAGYRVKDLSGSRTGLFVGVATMDYSDLLRENQIEIEAYSSTGASHCILANRISYMFNWRGPSEPIDTACSSSLIAIHRGVESIRNGDCDMAVAGGVNVMVSPMLHISFSRAGMLSEDGRCKTFDKNANGYVRGEGCGAVLLKPLSKAIEGGDHIYAVIKGTAVNHGGRANSLTAPNPNAQAELIATAFEKANFDPETVTYIEAHGTGTNLGDPVEINGLKLAFKELYKQSGKSMSKTNYCNLSSVKTNIGHLEAAAGIAGILKVLLAMKNKKIPGNVHLNEINPYIDIEGTPINIISKTKEWDNLVGEDGKIIPRRAGVSSFGFGGANAHIALEEYIQEYNNGNEDDSASQIIVLSAKSEDRLAAKAEQLAVYLQSEHSKNVSFRDIAYTLQIGRDDMEVRLAVVANDKQELIDKLNSFVNGDSNIPGLFAADAEPTKGNVLLSSQDEEDKEYLNLIIKKGKLDKIALLYTEGAEIDWMILHKGHTTKRVSLPTYPFAKDIYWVPKGSSASKTALLRVSAGGGAYSSLHPMVDINQSTLFEQTFKKTLKKEEFFLRDHIVNGKVLLPGVAYLEMVRAAGELAGIDPVSVITDIVWLQPIVMEEAEKDVYISLYPGKDSVRFEVYGIDKTEKVVNCEGNIYVGNISDLEGPRTFDIAEIKKRCTVSRNKEECYSVLYKSVGFDYGPAFQVTQELLSGENEVLVGLKLPEQLYGTFEQFVLHPSLMDGAIRAIAGMGDQKHGQVHIPFALGRMEVFASIPEKCYAYSTIVTETKGKDSGTMRFSISVLNEDGQELIRIKDFTARPYKEKRINNEVLYFKPEWENKAFGDGSQTLPAVLDSKNSNTLIVFSNLSSLNEKVSKLYNEKVKGGKVVLVAPGDRYAKIGENSFSINPAEYKDYCTLFGELINSGHTPAYILNLWNFGSDTPDFSAMKSPGVLKLKTDSLLSSGVYTAVNIFKAVNGIKLDSKVKCLFAFEISGDEPHPCLEAIAGFANSVPVVSRKFELITLQLEKNTIETTAADVMVGELILPGNTNGAEIKYIGGDRKVKSIKEVDASDNVKDTPLLRQGGVYVITGGLGSLGMLFARSLAENYKARLILTGRSKLDNIGRNKLKELEVLGAKLVYVSADISDYEDAENVIKTAKSEFGQINGVIHCAGILGSKPVIEADESDFQKVLLPKIHGTLNLDFATKDENLDLFIMFSSVSTEMGDFGACSYAVANSFMDRFAYLRDEMKVKGMRNGITVSINWPLWTEGGMEIPREQSDMYFTFSGMSGLDSENGLAAFYKILNLGLPQVIVTIGDAKKIKRSLKVKDSALEIFTGTMEQAAETGVSEDVSGTAQDKGQFFKAAEEYFKKILSESINLPPDRINSKASFEKYGIDSIMIMELNKRLEKDFESLTKTLFFEYNNIYELTGYFVDNYKTRLAEILKLDDEGSKDSEKSGAGIKPADLRKVNPAGKFSLGNRFLGMQITSDEINCGNYKAEDDDIAIIGLNGKYPMAKDLEEFWENLRNGRDCITEVPEERWGHSKYYDPQKGRKDRVYSKWGGFIDDVDKFDPLFFQITPRDAEIIDPQERMFLENVYGTLEDAGYTRSSLSNSKVGVFVGVMYGHYQLYGAEETMRGNPASLSSSYSSIANRISYFFNFQGPSIALDTMCSSSLTAIHLACESIHRGESEMAVAGGVNVTIHLDKYIFLCQQRFAASDGRCRAFGADGDGYVPGEGVGSVLLKPLKKALEDKDYIYAVIKSSSVNHGGKTSGYSVPNPNAQGSLIAEALKKAKINPRTISYLEAHGTGTSLGDPIEITGLMKAFGEYTKDRQYCRIGSVKSNIGHTESAAGIASLTKVLLQMKNKKLVPSIHSSTLNPNINFSDSPFMVQQKFEDWNNPVIIESGSETAYPRRAGISSFGAGGANVHLIIEEFENRNKEECITEEPQLVVVSARTEGRLKAYCKKISEFLTKQIYGEEDLQIESESIFSNVQEDLINAVSNIINISAEDINIDMDFEEFGFEPFTLSTLKERISEKYGINIPLKSFAQFNTISLLTKYIARESKVKADTPVKSNKKSANLSLSDVSYTLQVGREALDGMRLAVVVSTIEELIEKLEAFIGGIDDIENLYVKNLKKTKLCILETEFDEEQINDALRKRELTNIAKMWVSGADADWRIMYRRNTPNRIPMPKYPFERLRCWFTPSQSAITEDKAAVHEVLHPMIDANVSTLEEQCFKKVLSHKDFYLRDHVVRGNMMLPGVAYLEMVWAASLLSSRKNKVARLKNIVWASPIELKGKTLETYIGLFQGEYGVEYEVFTEGENGRVIHSKGKVDYVDSEKVTNRNQYINFEEIRQRCTASLKGHDLYEEFEQTGLKYGKGLRTIQSLNCNDHEILSFVRLPEGLEADFGSYTLHPGILDAALQSLAGFSATKAEGGRTLFLPFALGEIEVFKPLEKNCYIYITLEGNSASLKSGIRKYKIYIINEDGQVLVEIKDFSGREFKSQEVSEELYSQDNQPAGRNVDDDGDSEVLNLLQMLENGEMDIEKVEQLMEDI